MTEPKPTRFLSQRLLGWAEGKAEEIRASTRLLPILIRAGRYEASLVRCPGQKRIATMKNGEMGRTFWLPGLAINLRWGER